VTPLEENTQKQHTEYSTGTIINKCINPYPANVENMVGSE